MKVSALLLLLVAATASADVTMEDFSAPKHTWRQQNDPVMGGKSTGTFAVKNGVGVFDGEVVNVPFLKAPGFIKVSTTGFFDKFPDASACKALAIRAKSTTPDYKGFRVSFGNEHPKGAKTFAYGYKAHFSAPATTSTVVIPFTAFSDLWDDGTGDPIKTCAQDSQYCPDSKALKNLGSLSIWGEGVAGKVHLEVESITATQCSGANLRGATAPATAAPAARKALVTFDGAPDTTFNFEVEDDPVMGGQSKSAFHVDHGQKRGVWAGEVKVVPFLHAPGFCTVRTKDKASFPDVSGLDGLEVVLVSDASHVTKFQIQLETKGGRSGFKQGTYTGDFTVPATTPTGTTTRVFVPWSAFVLTWRGQKIKGPAITAQLSEITTVGLSTAFPGTAGTFHLEVVSLAASTAADAGARTANTAMAIA